jgi:hypothetical protein
MKGLQCFWLYFLFALGSSLSYAQTNETKFTILEAGLNLAQPVFGYKDRTSRMPLGLQIGLLYPTRFKDIYAGGQFSYQFHDRFSSEYEDVDAFGFPRIVYESVTNQHFALDFNACYMPDWFARVQPYVRTLAGVRRVWSSVVVRDAPGGTQINTFTYKGTWMVQVGAGVGLKWKIRNLIFDVGACYIETTPGSHLLRKEDWRTVPIRFSTDAFDEWRIPIQWVQFHVGMNFIL